MKSFLNLLGKRVASAMLFSILFAILMAACADDAGLGANTPLASAALAVESFTLIDAETDSAVPGFDPIDDGAVIDLSTLAVERFNVRANTRPEVVGSVRFDFDGSETYRIENTGPYALASDASGNYHPWELSVGSHTLSATPYTREGAGGEAGGALQVSFAVTDGSQVSEPELPPPPPPNGNPPTLLRDYIVLHEHGPRYGGITYRPRQFDTTPYESWDMLLLPGGHYRTYTFPDWLTVTLNRDATLIVVWDGDTPAGWLDDWEEVEPVDDKRAFKKMFPAGKVVLGAIEGIENQPYTLLLGEHNGEAPLKPETPVGVETPVANDYCPTWVHDQYLAKAPDGEMYRTWHPQIDPVYWCYFGHEHGSDPSLVGDYQPYFEYVAAHVPQDESHEGFKGYSIIDSIRRVNWYINVHAGTSDLRRICVPHHTVVVAAFDMTTREKLAELSYKGDFGPTKANSYDNPVVRPSECDNQAELDTQTAAEKKVRVANDNYYDDTGYETWRGGDKPFLGFEAGSLVFDFTDPMTSCDGIRCEQILPTASEGGYGVQKTIRIGNTRLYYRPELDPNGDGIFYTDVYGTKLLDNLHPNAVRQYVKPGFSVSLPKNEFNTGDAWRGPFYSGRFKTDFMNLEDSVRMPN